MYRKKREKEKAEEEKVEEYEAKTIYIPKGFYCFSLKNLEILPIARPNLSRLST